jgi:hypothetical protein
VLLRHAGALFRAAPPDAADFQPIGGRLAIDEAFFQGLLTLFQPPYGPAVGASDDQFRYDGEETLAGSLVYRIAVNQPSGARTATIWLDAASGFPLRLHRFAPDTQRLVSEVVVEAVTLDGPLPGDLMDPLLPWRGGFASDAAGAPELLPVATPTPPPEAAFAPPPNLDWSRQALELCPIPGRPPQAEVQVVAAGQALGVLQPLNPFQPQPCARSDDGRGLAWTYAAGASASWLTWARLDALDRLGRRDYPDGGASVFAFSPDGRQLAVFELRGPSGMISLIPVGGGTARPLLPLDDARSLVWKPDGAELGLIGRVTSPRLEEMVMVVRVRDGAVLYRQSIDTNAGNQRQEWPMEAWGVAFPVEMTTLADCLAAP